MTLGEDGVDQRLAAEDIEAEAGSSSHRKKPERKRGPAHAFQFGNTVIVEDEDGEVIKTYTLPPSEGQRGWPKNNIQHR